MDISLLKLDWLYEPFNAMEIIYGISEFNWLGMGEMKYHFENCLFQLFIIQAFRNAIVSEAWKNLLPL